VPAYAYLRKSHVKDPTREVSHEVQEAAVRDLAKRHGDNGASLTILDDWDLSGRLGRDKRPGYNTLLEAIESGACTALYSYSLSRLGRSVAELARLIGDCNARAIPVRLHADAVDTSTASGMLLFHVLSAVAQFEADVASERVRAALGAKLARGESLRTTPVYGEAAGEDVAAVLGAFREAGSYSGAAKLLNARGLKPRSSKRGVWWPSSVRVVVQRADPSVGAMRPTRGYQAGGSHFTLARLLRCPTCGTLLSGNRDRVDGPNGGRVRYACRLGTATPHPRISVSEHLILDRVREEADRLRTPEQVEATEDGAARAGLEARRLRIFDLYESGHIDKAERERRLERVRDGLAALDERRMVQVVPSIDWSWPPRELNRVLRALFERIELDPESFAPVAFVWRVPDWRADEAKAQRMAVRASIAATESIDL
jgi:DNA invertase Pin-like site-specific DNA recombinase